MNYADNMTMQTVLMAGAFVLTLINAAFAGLMWRMRATFVPRPEIEASLDDVRKDVDARLVGVTGLIAGFDARLRHVENDSSAAAAEVKGVKEAVQRVERLTMLLVEFRFKEAENAKA